MQQLAALLGTFSTVFLLGFGLTHLYLRLAKRRAEGKFKPVENAKVQMKTSSAMYRCRLLEFSDTEWIFSAPMQRDHFVPVSVGEKVVCEVIAHGGVMVFSSEVIARRKDLGGIVIAAPVSPKLKNRRESDRRMDIPMDVHVAGNAGAVIDLSQGGARVKIRGFQKEGQLVLVEMPGGESRGATVIESTHEHDGSVIRLQFNEPVTLPN